MKNLLYHPTTEHQLQAIIAGKPHAVVICGAAGVGKSAVANQLITGILEQKTSPYVLEIEPDGASIGIEQIRKIRDFLSRKTTGKAQIRRIVLVKKAHLMTTEAQNTLLKNLEEPPADTAIILLTDDMMALRLTIRSRSQQLLVLPVGQDAAQEYFGQLGYPETAITTAYFMSDGRPGLMAALLQRPDEHELVASINQAKEIIKMDNYNRLILVEKFCKQKDLIDGLLQGLERVVSGGLRQAAAQNNAGSTKKFYSLSLLVQETYEQIRQNGNTKLVLTRLFMQM